MKKSHWVLVVVALIGFIGFGGSLFYIVKTAEEQRLQEVDFDSDNALMREAYKRAEAEGGEFDEKRVIKHYLELKKAQK